MNHYALFISVMERKLQNEMLSMSGGLIFQLHVLRGMVTFLIFPSLAYTSVGVLSPFLFAVFIDGVVDKIKYTGVCCYYSSACVMIFYFFSGNQLAVDFVGCF